MKGVLIGIAIGFGLLVTHDADAAPWCDHVAGGSEAQAVQEASAAVDAGCPCDSFSRPGHYRSCLQNVLQDRVRAGLLSKVCARTVKSIILPNTCGYPDDAVACVRFKSRSTPGRRGCRI